MGGDRRNEMTDEEGEKTGRGEIMKSKGGGSVGGVLKSEV